MLKNEGGERRLKLGLTRVRVAFLGKIFEKNLRGMEAEAEGRPEGPLEFAANFGRKFYPKKGSVTLANPSLQSNASAILETNPIKMDLVR